jgi:hypothetical protein
VKYSTARRILGQKSNSSGTKSAPQGAEGSEGAAEDLTQMMWSVWQPRGWRMHISTERSGLLFGGKRKFCFPAHRTISDSHFHRTRVTPSTSLLPVGSLFLAAAPTFTGQLRLLGKVPLSPAPGVEAIQSSQFWGHWYCILIH